MLFEEFDMKEYVKMERRDSFAEGKAEALLDVLEDKGTVSAELRIRIQSEQNLDLLKRWLKLAAGVSTITEFEEKM